jgi:hypothetical protein
VAADHMSDVETNQVWVTETTEVPPRPILQDLLALRNQLTRTVQRLLAASDSGPNGSACHSCSRVGCEKPCDQLEAYLDSPYRGRIPGHPTRTGMNSGGLRDEEGSPEPALPELANDEPVYVVFVNGKGHPARESEVQSINLADYAVCLDVTRDMLGIHLPGAQPSLRSVRDAGIDGVQDILGVMIEHPRLNFGNVNIGLYLPHRAGMTPDAFRKATAKVRYGLQGDSRNGPLLFHFENSHYSISASGHAWRISSSEGDLCLVRFLLPAERFRPKRRR